MRREIKPWACSTCGVWEAPRLVLDDGMLAWLIEHRSCLRCMAWASVLADPPPGWRTEEGRAWAGSRYLGRLPVPHRARRRSPAPPVDEGDEDDQGR